MVPVEQFIVAAAEAPGAGVAEFRGLLPTMFLVSFQFLDIAEAPYVANLHLLTAVNGGERTGNGRIRGRNDAAARSSSFAASSSSSPHLPRSNSFSVFRSPLGLHGSKPRSGGGLR